MLIIFPQIKHFPTGISMITFLRVCLLKLVLAIPVSNAKRVPDGSCHGGFMHHKHTQVNKMFLN